MKFDYTLTRREFARSLSLAGSQVVGAWMAYAIVTASLFPSMGLFMFIAGYRSLAWFVIMSFSLAIMTAVAFWRRTGYPIPYPESMELTENHLNYHFRNSRIQWRWERIERTEETPQEFLFYSLGRSVMLPKRVLGEQADAVRERLARIQPRLHTTNPTPNPNPTPTPELDPQSLYCQLIAQDSGAAGFTYQVTRDDFEVALNDKFELFFRPLDSSPPVQGSAQAGAQKIKPRYHFVSLGVMVLGVGLLAFLSDGKPFIWWQFMLTVIGWVLPLVLVWRWVRWKSSSRYRKHRDHFFEEESTLKLLPQGWVIANPTAGTWGDWRDLTMILQSENFYGFKMVNELAYLIPKRIFPSPEVEHQFVQQAIELLSNRIESPRDFQASFEPVRISESNNPYQSPQR